TLSHDGNTLYAVNSGSNSIAVIPLFGRNANKVSGLIPTAYEPHDITFSADGSWLYIINGKSVTGPNTGHLSGNTDFIGCPTNVRCNSAAGNAARATNEYQFQLERASLVAAPVPGSHDLEELTERVGRNNFYTTEEDKDSERTMHFLHEHIKH